MALPILKKNQSLKRVGIYLVILTTGCASFLAKEAKEKPQMPATASGFSDGDSLEFKQAKTWIRVQELEEQVLTLKERVALLEEGFLLQINPKATHPQKLDKQEKYQPPSTPKEKPKAEPLASTNKDLLPESIKNHDHVQMTEAVVITDQEVVTIYKKKILEAKNLFEEGKFGNAYLDFSKLDQEFGDQVAQGEPKFWIARCWYALKEYQNAKQSLERFIDVYKTSDHFVAAKFYIAKSELGLGLTNQARKRLKEIVTEHPYEEHAEQAKQLLVELSHDFS